MPTKTTTERNRLEVPYEVINKNIVHREEVKRVPRPVPTPQPVVEIERVPNHITEYKFIEKPYDVVQKEVKVEKVIERREKPYPVPNKVIHKEIQYVDKPYPVPEPYDVIEEVWEDRITKEVHHVAREVPYDVYVDIPNYVKEEVRIPYEVIEEEVNLVPRTVIEEKVIKQKEYKDVYVDVPYEEIVEDHVTRKIPRAVEIRKQRPVPQPITEYVHTLVPKAVPFHVENVVYEEEEHVERKPNYVKKIEKRIIEEEEITINRHPVPFFIEKIRDEEIPVPVDINYRVQKHYQEYVNEDEEKDTYLADSVTQQEIKSKVDQSVLYK